MVKTVNPSNWRVKFHPKQGLRIPAPFLRQAGFKEKEEYVIKISTPIINIIPIEYRIDQTDQEEEKDWFDELLENPIARKNFDRILEETEQEYKEGKLQPIENLFKKLGV